MSSCFRAHVNMPAGGWITQSCRCMIGPCCPAISHVPAACMHACMHAAGTCDMAGQHGPIMQRQDWVIHPPAGIFTCARKQLDIRTHTHTDTHRDQLPPLSHTHTH
eukprot:GHVU01232492.1.p4 GENE.GHVU01232492.1~~GHVU01232492.1.p4  ORF type:complete len:106 (-),score=1.98 GHVU01232492.1:232-549(-)